MIECLEDELNVRQKAIEDLTKFDQDKFLKLKEDEIKNNLNLKYQDENQDPKFDTKNKDVIILKKKY